jgi:DNA-binding XRE family transcriptional regulator
MDWEDEVGIRLARTRRVLGLTQEELAERLNVSRGALSSWEVGARLPDQWAMCRLKGTVRRRDDRLDLRGRPVRTARAARSSTPRRGRMSRDVTLEWSDAWHATVRRGREVIGYLEGGPRLGWRARRASGEWSERRWSEPIPAILGHFRPKAAILSGPRPDAP